MKKQHIRNNIKFIRYGNLSSIKHKKYIKDKMNNKHPDWEEWDEEIGYHSPPVKKGIYAFVYPYVEKFLLTGDRFSGLKSTHPKFEFIKDKEGNKILYNWDIKGNEENGIGYYNTDQLVDQNQVELLKKILKKSNELPKDYSFETYKDGKYVLVKRIKPKIFSYQGEIWHHLESFLDSKGSIIERKGAWVKTDFLDYKLALQKAMGKVNRRNSCHWTTSRDFLEVFIEKIN